MDFKGEWFAVILPPSERTLIYLSSCFSFISLVLVVRTMWFLRRQYWLPKSIILIRHGESEGNMQEDTYQTTPDPLVPLSERGEEQSEQLGKALKQKIGNSPVWVYCSPYIRARQTAMIALSQLDPDQVVYVREDPRLREQEFCASFQSGPASRDERNRYSKFFYRWLRGESAADVFDRVSVFMASIWRDFNSTFYGQQMGDNGVILIFTHGLTMRIFLMSWLHWRHEEFDASRNPDNCEMLELQRISFDRHAFQLTPESRTILFQSQEHHIRRSSVALHPPALLRHSSWVDANKEEMWFHNIKTPPPSALRKSSRASSVDEHEDATAVPAHEYSTTTKAVTTDGFSRITEEETKTLKSDGVSQIVKEETTRVTTDCFADATGNGTPLTAVKMPGSEPSTEIPSARTEENDVTNQRTTVEARTTMTSPLMNSEIVA